MKKQTLLIAILSFLFCQTSFAQDNNAKTPPSPPAKIIATIGSGANISINYSQPAVKGRNIGINLEPMDGKVWRTGANNATVFESDKDLVVEGKTLAAGKYGLFSILQNGEWTIIFNKTWKQWGAFQYKEADDVLRITVKDRKPEAFAERMTFLLTESGNLSLNWGEHQFNLQLK